MIVTSMPKEEHNSLVRLLDQSFDVFAWTSEEMSGVDPGVISHRLGLDPRARPVLQKQRKLTPERQVVVNEEVDKLLVAGVIREVHYPEWLSNTIVVLKKDKKWRVCVDFTDLNKAYPKDSFPLLKNDPLVDAMARHKRMRFLDAY